MARKTNDEVKDMNLNQIESYVDDHPSEGFRMAKVIGKTVAYCVEKNIEHAVQKSVKSTTPLRPRPNDCI